MVDHVDYPFLYYSAVNRAVNPYLMKDDELWDSVNFWTERTLGAKKVRPGLTPFLDQVDTNPVKGLFYIKFPNGYNRLARASGKIVYAVDPTTASSWGAAKINITGSNFLRPDFTVLNATGHLVDQPLATESHYIEWTNSAGTDSMTDTTYASGADTVIPYKGAVCCTYHQRVYVGSPYYAPNRYRSRLSWSTIEYAAFNAGSSDPASAWTEDPTGNDITAANFRDIDKDYKGSVIKVTNINDRINLYKEGGIYRYNESSVFSLFGLSPIQGTVATMPETQEDYFLTNEGFFKTDGNKITPISDGWYPIIKQIFKNGLTPSKFNSFSINFLYFCYVGDVTYDGQTLSNCMFVYSAKYGELSLWSMGVDISAMGYYVNASKDNVIVIGDVNGKTYTLDYNANDDAGTSILAYLKTKYYFFDSVVNKNNLDQCHAFATLPSEMEVFVDRDFKGEYKEFMTIDDLHSKSRADFSKFGQFYTISFKIVWNGKGVRPEFSGIVPKVIQGGTRFEQKKR